MAISRGSPICRRSKQDRTGSTIDVGAGRAWAADPREGVSADSLPGASLPGLWPSLSPRQSGAELGHRPVCALLGVPEARGRPLGLTQDGGHGLRGLEGQRVPFVTGRCCPTPRPAYSRRGRGRSCASLLRAPRPGLPRKINWRARPHSQALAQGAAAPPPSDLIVLGSPWPVDCTGAAEEWRRVGGSPGRRSSRRSNQRTRVGFCQESINKWK
ncbi:hypothetical protein NDU88_001586 [Pleurodeles waltl]|uniref:Uncharacterized protein n=1 Tax=Pleurodeles waltl TaxID=8319 RepID=A0AAV7LDL1_PLEWA|nr:hypothetical protein NDU88_001586 [Pleurodeles waltl]